MNIVIQCAARKHHGGSLTTRDGQKVHFVANPELASELAPLPPDCIYARPDGRCLDAPGYTWLQRLEEYVLNEPKNPLGLLDAYELYNPKFNPIIYRKLVEQFKEKVFILSAGWGLIRADYPTPAYNDARLYSGDERTLAGLQKKCQELTWPYLKKPTRTNYEYFFDKLFDTAARQEPHR